MAGLIIIGSLLLVGIAFVVSIGSLLTGTYRRAGAWAARGRLLAGIAVLIYTIGFLWGDFLSWRSDENCTAKTLAYPPTLTRLFPLENLCRWADGTTTDRVPFLINPLFFLCLVGAVVCVGIAVARRRSRRRIDSTERAS